jgi:cell division septation protein DedD
VARHWDAIGRRWPDLALDRRTPAPERSLASRPALDELVAASKRTGKAAESKPSRLAAKDAKAKTKASEEEAKPIRATASVSRIYVQLAGGANADRMGREFDRIRKTKAALFRSRQPLVSEVKGWSRLLVGPFKDADEAQEFVNDLHAAKLEGFVWTAPGGLKLEKLASK